MLKLNLKFNIKDYLPLIGLIVLVIIIGVIMAIRNKQSSPPYERFQNIDEQNFEQMLSSFSSNTVNTNTSVNANANTNTNTNVNVNSNGSGAVYGPPPTSSSTSGSGGSSSCHQRCNSSCPTPCTQLCPSQPPPPPPPPPYQPPQCQTPQQSQCPQLQCAPCPKCPPICRSCPDVSKYILKTSIPPCPSINYDAYMRKTDCRIPDMSKYILKSSIPSFKCPACICPKYNLKCPDVSSQSCPSCPNVTVTPELCKSYCQKSKKHQNNSQDQDDSGQSSSQQQQQSCDMSSSSSSQQGQQQSFQPQQPSQPPTMEEQMMPSQQHKETMVEKIKDFFHWNWKDYQTHIQSQPQQTAQPSQSSVQQLSCDSDGYKPYVEQIKF